MVANDLIEVTRETAATLGGDEIFIFIFILLIMHFFAVKSYLNILDKADMLYCERPNEIATLMKFHTHIGGQAASAHNTNYNRSAS